MSLNYLILKNMMIPLFYFNLLYTIGLVLLSGGETTCAATLPPSAKSISTQKLSDELLNQTMDLLTSGYKHEELTKFNSLLKQLKSEAIPKQNFQCITAFSREALDLLQNMPYNSPGTSRQLLFLSFEFSKLHTSSIIQSRDKYKAIPSLERTLTFAHNILQTSPGKRSSQKILEDSFTLLEAYKVLQGRGKSPPTLHTIQTQLLGSRQALLEYFWGEEQLFLLVLQPQKANLQRIPLNKELHNNLSFVLNNLQHLDTEIDVQQYIFALKQLSDSLIPATDRALSRKINELIIVPDGPLFNLSFDVLLQNNFTATCLYSLKKLPYLIRYYAISYVHAASFLSVSRKNPTENNILFAGFAPVFNPESEIPSIVCGNEIDPVALNCNVGEVTAINQYFPGKILAGPQANLENLVRYSKQATILHLATHACYQHENQAFGKLHLQDGVLSEKELENINFSADLLVLSACHTARMHSETPSPAHALITQGTPAVLGSLWTLEDCIAANLMNCFYKNLSLGYSKNIALRKAKLQFLEKADQIHQHPYFWASLVSLGSQLPIVPQNNDRQIPATPQAFHPTKQEFPINYQLQSQAEHPAAALWYERLW